MAKGGKRARRPGPPAQLRGHSRASGLPVTARRGAAGESPPLITYSARREGSPRRSARSSLASATCRQAALRRDSFSMWRCHGPEPLPRWRLASALPRECDRPGPVIGTSPAAESQQKRFKKHAPVFMVNINRFRHEFRVMSGIAAVPSRTAAGRHPYSGLCPRRVLFFTPTRRIWNPQVTSGCFIAFRNPFGGRSAITPLGRPALGFD